jgi:hypothetical protein
MTTWDVYGTSQTGSVEALALSDVYFNTVTVPGSPNTVRLFLNGRQIQVKASGGQQCPATPTPTATATATPTEAPIIPTPEPEPTAQPEPTQTPTPQPTFTATPTATPIPLVVFSGIIKGKNGRNLSSTEILRMPHNLIKVSAVGSRGEYAEVRVNPDYTWSIELPVGGTYTVSMVGSSEAGRLVVTSRPVRYTRIKAINNRGGLHFAVSIVTSNLESVGDVGDGSRPVGSPKKPKTPVKPRSKR